MEKKQKVQKIKNTIHNLEVELTIIQGKCTHTDQTIKMVKPGEVRWVCDGCEIKLKWLNPDDLKKWLGYL